MRSTAWLALTAGLLGSFASGLSAQGRTVAESEPNDSVRTANPITSGDTVTGVMNPNEDYDVFALDLLAGTKLQILVLQRGFNMMYSVSPAAGGGVGKDGGDSSPDTLNYLVPSDGRYYVRITSYAGASAPNNTYRVRVGPYVPPPPGPGDPVTLVVGNIGSPKGIAAGPSGELYILHDQPGGPHLSRVNPGGATTQLATALPAYGSLAIHESGDLLVPTFGSFERAEGGTVWRYLASGQRIPFVVSPPEAKYSLQGVTVGPDGDVWFTDPTGGTWSRFWRYSTAGVLKDTIHIDVGRVFELAFSPAGELHFPVQFGGSVYKLVNGRPQVVISTFNPPDVTSANYDPGVSQLVFDRDGYLYATDNRSGGVVLFDPSYRAVSKPFAWVVDEPGWTTARAGFAMAFGRDASGTTTTQLLVAQGWDEQPRRGGIYELDRSAIRAPGWPVGKQSNTTVTVTVAEIATALMGGTALTAAQVQFLDSRGNKNGVLDVGDLRAYLRSQGQLNATALSGAIGPIIESVRP